MIEFSDLRYTELLEDDLHAVEQRLTVRADDVPTPVLQAVHTLIQSGGKRLRPALVLLTTHLFGGDANALDAARWLAAAVEMLHTATLIHDDFIDGTATRRGIPTLNSHWSSTATVLVGDLAFAWAARLAAQGDDLEIIHRFTETLEIICGGELAQIFRDQDTSPTVKRYYRRIFAKTASLFALATETGARLANGTPADVEALRRFGRLVGLAFQITDDVLDVIGDKVTLGKPAGSDLRQGLATLPVLYYREAHPEDERVTRALNGESDEAELEALLTDLQHAQAPRRALTTARSHADEALNILRRYPTDPYREALEEVARFAVERSF
jgi:geranylgeranyl pyrophosphate synthase